MNKIFKRSALTVGFFMVAFNVSAQSSSQSKLPQNQTMSKQQLLTATKTAVNNIELLEAFQTQLMAFMPAEQREKIEAEQLAEQQKAASCMGISVEKLSQTESLIKSDKQKMLSSIDQCSVHLPETVALNGSNQTQIQPFASCMYGLGAKELGVSLDVAQQCGYGELLVQRYSKF